MSSKLEPIHYLRKKREAPKEIADFPQHIQDVLNTLIRNFGEIGIYGSYQKGTWVSDSDLDVGIKDCNINRIIVKSISKFYNIQIDCIEINNNMLKLK